MHENNSQQPIQYLDSRRLDIRILSNSTFAFAFFSSAVMLLPDPVSVSLSVFDIDFDFDFVTASTCCSESFISSNFLLLFDCLALYFLDLFFHGRGLLQVGRFVAVSFDLLGIKKAG